MHIQPTMPWDYLFSAQYARGSDRDRKAKMGVRQQFLTEYGMSHTGNWAEKGFRSGLSRGRDLITGLRKVAQ